MIIEISCSECFGTGFISLANNTNIGWACTRCHGYGTIGIDNNFIDNLKLSLKKNNDFLVDKVIEKCKNKNVV